MAHRFESSVGIVVVVQTGR
ncbi:hypothetical protein CEXT_487481, partial [Caerostris extrusa]